jgi:hypothetical protein
MTYGAKFNVTLDCCWSKKQAKRRIKQLKTQVRNQRVQMNRSLGREKGGVAMLIRAQQRGAGQVWKAAYHQKQMKKYKRLIRKIRRCKRYPCFPSFKKSLNGFGYIPDRHGDKVHPWLVRLAQASSSLVQNVKRKNTSEVVRSIEDVSFWQGRVMCDLLSSEGSGFSQPRVHKVLLRSRSSLNLARSFLEA